MVSPIDSSHEKRSETAPSDSAPVAAVSKSSSRSLSYSGAAAPKEPNRKRIASSEPDTEYAFQDDDQVLAKAARGDDAKIPSKRDCKMSCEDYARVTIFDLH